MISLLAFLTSLAGFLNEMNFAQALTAALGGTTLRYQTTFGLFTFALGFGAWAFEHPWFRRYSARSALLASQLLMIAISAGGCYWIAELNPLNTNNSLWAQSLVYIPILLCGLITGFELPALLHLQQKNNSPLSPLAWDYIGMFIASLLFPLYMVYSLGVFRTSIATSAIALFCTGLIFFRIPKAPPKTFALEQQKMPAPRLLIYTLIFILSFCSFCYELLAAKMIGDLIQNETLAYSAGVGIMLVGIGLGTFRAQHSSQPIKTLVRVELALVLLGLCTFAILHTIGAFVHAYPYAHFITQSQWLGLVCLSPFPLALGFFTGYELPCLLKLLKTEDQASHGKALAMNYLGALAGGFITPLLLIPLFSVEVSLRLTASLNFLVLCGLVAWTYKKTFFKALLIPALGASLFAISPSLNRWIEQIYLKTYYYQIHLPHLNVDSFSQYLKLSNSIKNVKRESSMYQYIDKVENYNPGHIFHNDGFLLFLNKQQQLDSTSWKKYHQSFSLGALNLHSQPIKNVLVCGGGDGLLAQALLQIPSLQSIKLIELDPRMLDLATTDTDLVRINSAALLDPKVTAIVGDAYSFAHLNEHKFDAIFLDFPYPDSLDLSRLYSLEFYRAILDRLEPDGFIVLDAPIWRYIDKTSTRPAYELKILKDTLMAAGFKSVFAYGPHEPFIFATPQERTLAFNYDQLKEISNSTFINLVSLDYLLSDPQMPNSQMINSVYKPQRFFKNE